MEENNFEVITGELKVVKQKENNGIYVVKNEQGEKLLSWFGEDVVEKKGFQTGDQIRAKYVIKGTFNNIRTMEYLEPGEVTQTSNQKILEPTITEEKINNVNPQYWGMIFKCAVDLAITRCKAKQVNCEIKDINTCFEELWDYANNKREEKGVK